MGCTETRPESNEENGIIFAEKGLGFHLRKASKIDAVFRKYANNEKLNEDQLSKAVFCLKCTMQNYGKFRYITEMYSKLKREDGDYDLKDLLVIGILLGEGSKEEKARLLYQVFDETSENAILKDKMRSDILEKICFHSTSTLGGLYCNDVYSGSNELRNLKYISDLMVVREIGIKQITDEMCDFSIVVSEERFIKFMSTFMNGALLAPTGWRGYMRDVYALNPPKKTYTTAYTRKLASVREQKLEKLKDDN